MNLCRVPLGQDGSAAFGGLSVALPGIRANGRTEVTLGVRPEALELADEGVEATVEAIEELGSDAFIFCSSAVGATRLVARVPTRSAPERGTQVRLRPSAEYAPHVFDAGSGERIGA
jgi:multiple sugar transport system ATP-binding protein